MSETEQTIFIDPDKTYSEVVADDSQEQYMNDLSSKSILNRKSNYYAEAITEKPKVTMSVDCPFCTHPARVEAEMLWEDRKNRKEIIKFFNDYTNKHPECQTLTPEQISRHLYRHHENRIKKAILEHYSENVMQIINHRISKDRMMDEMVGAMVLEKFEVMGDEKLDRVKRIECLTKIDKNIRDTIELQMKIRGETVTTDSIMNACVSSFKQIILKSKDKEVKKGLYEALDTFQKNLEFPENARTSVYEGNE